jgi:hypothetical protein
VYRFVFFETEGAPSEFSDIAAATRETLGRPN